MERALLKSIGTMISSSRLMTRSARRTWTSIMGRATILRSSGLTTGRLSTYAKSERGQAHSGSLEAAEAEPAEVAAELAEAEAEPAEVAAGRAGAEEEAEVDVPKNRT